MGYVRTVHTARTEYLTPEEFNNKLHRLGRITLVLSVVFLVALLVAILQNPKLSFDRKLEVISESIGNKDIVTMILIFLSRKKLRKVCLT